MKNKTDAPIFAIFGVLLLSFACGPKHTVTPLEKGTQLFENESYGEAKIEFEALVKKEPENATAMAYLGRIAMANDDADKAIEWYEKAASLDETNSSYQFWLAQAYLKKIQTVSFMERGALAPKAKESLEKAVELNPENVDALVYLGSYCLNAPPVAGGSVKKAAEYAEQVKILDPSRGHPLMAQVFVKNKDYESAEKEYMALLEMNRHDADSHYQLGFFYQTAEWWDKASAAFEKALEIEPKHMNALYQMGRTGVFSGENLNRAAECLKLYLTLEPGPGSPTLGNAHWRLGMIYEKQGNEDLAKAEYEAALKLDPNDTNAKEALEKLQSDK